MGTDACIFAKKAKQYFYFDRRYNFRPEELPEEQQERYHIGLGDTRWRKDGVRTPDSVPGLTAAEVLEHSRRNMLAWASEPDDSHRVYWNREIAAFAAQFPDDEFFVADDSVSPEHWDVAEEYGFV